MILNNISETFNGYILNSRGKHIIHMLEDIRTTLMERLFRKMEEVRDHHHRVCPEIVEKIEGIKERSRFCILHATSDVQFEVENYGYRFVVDVKERTCSCTTWDISGIPCIHACAAIHFLRDDAYDVDHYKETYKHRLPPLNGEDMWPMSEGYPVLPPPAKKMLGRTKKNRKKDPNEGKSGTTTKLRRTGLKMTCTKCKQEGHNRTTCKKEDVSIVPKPRGKPGRPRKAPPLPQTTMHDSTTMAAAKTQEEDSGLTSMGEARNVYTRMPLEKRTIFIPARPNTSSSGVKKRTKKKILNTSTQESHV